MCKRVNRFFPCLLAFFMIASIAISYWMINTDYSMPYWQQTLISQGLLLLPGIVYVLVNHINVYECIPYRRLSIRDCFLSLVTGYMLIPVVTFINMLSSMFVVNHVEESVEELTSYPFALQVLLLAVIPPLVEEFIFRGIFYHSYRKNGLVGAAVFSALVFGVIHMNLNQFLYAFVVGIVFAKMVEVTGSMWSSVLAHFAFNTYSITVLEIVKVLGIDLEQLDQTGAAATIPAQLENLVGSDMAQGMITVISTITTLVVLGVIAVIFLILANMIINCMAKMNGRYEYYRYYAGFGLRPMNNESFVTLPYILTVVFAFIYMILIEISMYIG